MGRSRINREAVKDVGDEILRALTSEEVRASADLSTSGLLDYLTKQLAENEDKRPATPKRVWDTGVPQLFLRVLMSGRTAFYVQWARGHSKSIGKYPGTTVAHARDRARAALVSASKAADGVPDIARPVVQPGSVTVEEFILGEYRDHLRANRKTRALADLDENRLLRVLRPCLKKDVQSIKYADLQGIMNRRAVTPATKQRDRNSIRAAFAFALRMGRVEKNPAQGLVLGEAANTMTATPRFLSPDEEARLLRVLAARDERARAARRRTIAGGRTRNVGLREIADHEFPDHLTPLVLVALHTGCRRGELFKMRWSDVSLDAELPQILVRKENAKSGKDRQINLNRTARDALIQWRRQNPGAGLVFGLADVKKAWGAVLQEAEIEDFRFHDLRHTFASKLVQRGSPLNTVRELLGHGDIKMTLRYSHLRSDNLAAAVAMLDDPEPTSANVIRLRA